MYSQQVATKPDEYRLYINILFQDFLEYYLLINIYVSQEVFIYVQTFRQVSACICQACYMPTPVLRSLT